MRSERLSGGTWDGSGPDPWETGAEPWVELRSTHSGAVLLLGPLAHKVKLPVRLGFLDFRTLAARTEACRQEVALNRRLAPDVYLGLGSLTEPGAEAEPTVVMRRMPAAARLRTMVLGEEDVSAHLVALARVVATFHVAARRGPEVDREGTRDAIRQRWEDSFAQVRSGAHPGIDELVLSETERHVRDFLEGREPLFDQRVAAGRVVDGHGDLLAEDIFCLPDGPRVLDCLDFDPRLRYLDQLDDACCLVMDLEQLGAPRAAEELLEHYLEHTADPAPPALVHHFVAYRAFVRAKVGCLRGAAADAAEVADHARLCLDHLRAGAVRLVLVGGSPGTGKTTLAGALADRLGFVTISSDRVRKEVSGLPPDQPARAAYGEGIYDRETTGRTYDELLRRTGLLLEQGESVVLDATWSDPDQRRAAERLARLHSADLVALRCDLPLPVVRERVAERVGPSDADAAVAERAAAEFPAWPEAQPIDTGLPLEAGLSRAVAVLGRHDVGTVEHPRVRRR